MTAPEFSRTVRVDTLGVSPRTLAIEADEAERAALARRFGLLTLDRLEAEVSVSRAGATADVAVAGTLRAAATQACVVGGEPLPETVETPFHLLFRSEPDAGSSGDEEVEIGEEELDVVFYDGALVDVGEAAAQTLALALDPFPRAPDAGQALAEGLAGQPKTGPFSALDALKSRLGG